MSPRILKSLISTFFLCCLLSGATAVAADYFKEAYALYQSRQFADAARLFDQALAANPRDSITCYYAAISHQQAGHSSRALALYRQVVRLAPGSKIASYAQTYLAKIDPASASDTAAPVDSAHKAESADQNDVALEGPAQASVYYREGDREMWLPVQINGRNIEMELDTGAPGITLGKNQCKSIGLQYPSGPASGLMGGSSNDTTQPYWAMKATIKVGPIILHDVTVKVMQYNSSDPLLGQAFLKYFDWSVDQGAHCIKFRRKGLNIASTAQSGYSIPFTFREAGHRIILDVEVNERKGKMMMDTGNSAAGVCFGSLRQAQQYGARIPEEGRLVSHSGVSGSGRAYAFALDRLRVGPIDRRNVSCSANVDTDDDEEPLLGYEIFEGWEYTVDMQKRVIHLLRR